MNALHEIELDVDPRGRNAVESLVADGVCAAVVYPVQTLSTSSLAVQSLRAGEVSCAEGPVLFVTDRQTGGRGRHGRTWKSGEGSLTFSIIANAPDPTSGAGHLTGLAVGVAIAQAIEFDLAPLKTRLKWPNDVYVDGGKVAGILLETVAGFAGQAVVGVGVNVGQRPDLGDDPGAADVRDLASATGRTLHRYDLLPALVRQIVDTIALIDRNVDDLLSEFRQRCLLTDRQITFRRGTESCRGHCRGIGPTGELIIETDQGRERLTSGEAHLVRTV